MKSIADINQDIKEIKQEISALRTAMAVLYREHQEVLYRLWVWKERDLTSQAISDYLTTNRRYKKVKNKLYRLKSKKKNKQLKI